jgi:hypothetical protein
VRLPSSLRETTGRALLWLGAPRRGRLPRAEPAPPPQGPTFEIQTFVTDERLYEEMRGSFIAAGFGPAVFVRLSDSDEDPYRAINRIGRESTAQYVILCHQDVRADLGAGAGHLLDVLHDLDSRDPAWVAAGDAGVMRDGRVIRRLRDPYGGSTREELPQPVVTLDENLLVLNVRSSPHCSPVGRGFHLYATDLCLTALQDGGSAYVIDFPVTHLSDGRGDRAGYERVLSEFVAAQNARSMFRYVLTPQGVVFVSRVGLLRRVFGSQRVIAWVGQRRGVRSA